MDEDQKQRQDLIKGIIGRNSDDKLQDIANRVMQVNKERGQVELDRMEIEKESSMERIKLQIVTENEAEVQ